MDAYSLNVNQPVVLDNVSFPVESNCDVVQQMAKCCRLSSE